MHAALNHLEVIANLAYLIESQPDDSAQVKARAKQIVAECQTLGEVLRDKSMLQPAKGRPS